MSFEVLKLPPIFFNNPKITRIQNDFLVRMNKNQEIEFIDWFAKRVQRIVESKNE